MEKYGKRGTRHLKRLIAISLVLLPTIVHAGIDVDDLMSIAWEGLWNQNGSPAPLRKWNQPLRVRVSGDADSLHKNTISEGLKEITQAAGLEYSVLESDDNTENVLIEVVNDSPKLGPTTPCSTHMEWSGNGMKKATVTAKGASVYQCMLHELGHVAGIEGHPYGRTVMTYFNRRNEVSDYDKFILKARNSPETKHGMLPFRVLKNVGDKYVASLASEDERMQARQSIDKFMASVLHSMQQYAEGKGEPPLVIYRSGRISKQSMEAGRIPMQYYLGEALLEGDLGIVDPGKATELLQKSAANKYQPAVWSLAWRYQNGKGFSKDPMHAYAWYAYAASLGNQNAKKRLTGIEEKVAPSELPAYQEAAAELQAKLGEQAAKQDATAAQ